MPSDNLGRLLQVVHRPSDHSRESSLQALGVSDLTSRRHILRDEPFQRGEPGEELAESCRCALAVQHSMAVGADDGEVLLGVPSTMTWFMAAAVARLVDASQQRTPRTNTRTVVLMT